MTFLRIVSVVLLFGSSVLNAATLSEAILARTWHTLDGEPVRLENFRGDRPVYLKFWATWCGTCMEEMPHLQGVYHEFGRQVEVLPVNLGVNDDIESLTRTRQERRWRPIFAECAHRSPR